MELAYLPVLLDLERKQWRPLLGPESSRLGTSGRTRPRVCKGTLWVSQAKEQEQKSQELGRKHSEAGFAGTAVDQGIFAPFGILLKDFGYF